MIHLAARAGVRYSLQNPQIYVKAIIEGQPIKLLNQGQMRRDFTYVDDVTEGAASSSGRQGSAGVINSTIY